jgi:farnesyl-diphosphate farnesyltransferase
MPDETARLLQAVSRTFSLSLAVLHASVRPVVGLAYLLARAADTIADTRLIERRQRIGHLEALRAELDAPGGSRLARGASAAAAAALPAERALLERLPDCLEAYRALPLPDRASVRALLLTLTQGMLEDLRAFPGEDAGTLAALDNRAALERYTYLVAGCAGEFWTDVHAAHRPRLRRRDLDAMRGLGVRFGQGLQLTNVLRDVPRDLRQGRCYLPREDLQRLGLAPRDLLDPAASDAARPLRDALIRSALERFEDGWRYVAAVPAAEGRMRLASVWPLLIGLRTLGRLAGTGRWLDPDLVVKVPRGEVYGVLACSGALGWSRGVLGWQVRRARRRIPL